MPNPREVELKFEVEPSELLRLRERGPTTIAAEPGSSEHFVTVYYDTGKLKLRRKRLSLRVRKSALGWTQTIKGSRGSDAGLFDRTEWETALETEQRDLEAAAGTPLQGIVGGQQGGRRLRPVFETVVDRTTWTLRQNAVLIEVALDLGQVSASGAAADFAEIELELKEGSLLDLFSAARALAEVTSLKIGVVGKSDRGYALLDGEAGQRPFKAEPVSIEPQTTTGVAFRTIAHACLRQFRLNEALLLDTQSVEALHQARVGMRRLRSALSLFKPVIADSQFEPLRLRLRDVSTELGAARNLDVYLADALKPESERFGSEPGLPDLIAHMQAERERAYQRLRERLNSREFRTLMLDLLAWIEAGAWSRDTHNSNRDGPIEAFAARVLHDRRRKVKKKGDHLDQLEPEARHAVRIQAKKLRYAAEFFAGTVVDRKHRQRHETFVKALSEFQDYLGELNDVVTGHELATNLARELQGKNQAASLLFAAGHVSGEHDERTKALLASAADAHARFAAVKPFWRTT